LKKKNEVTFSYPPQKIKSFRKDFIINKFRPAFLYLDYHEHEQYGKLNGLFGEYK